MNENEQVEKNQNNELVQSSETNSQNLKQEEEKATPLENEVAFSEVKDENMSSGIELPQENVKNIEEDIKWETIKIEDNNIGYNYINNDSNNIEIEKNKKNHSFFKILKNKWFYISVILLISIISLIITILKITSDNNTKQTEQNNQNIENIESSNNQTSQELDSKTRRKTDGILINKEDANNWPFAVIIENNIDARPLSGVNDANIIYEALVEGSITRLLCIYSGSENIGKIGPVRSARPYFTDLADEYNSLFIHFGGSPEALDRLKKGFYNVTDLDGIIYDGIYLWRDKTRSAPHNAYISSDLIQKYKENTGKDKQYGDFSEWLFNESNIDNIIDPKNLSLAKNVYIQYSDQTTFYNIDWKYDKENDLYTRYYENDKIDKDSLNKEITTKNIIIQFTSTNVINGDDKFRKSINLTEGGKAIMIRNGYSIEGYWKKNSFTNRTKFYTKINGVEKEFEFNPGKTWVNIVPKDYKIKID